MHFACLRIQLTRLLVAAACWASSAGCLPATTPAGRDPSESLVRQCLDRVNDLRLQEGLAPLKRCGDLDRIALAHTREMVRMHRLSHTGADGGVLAQRLNRSRIDWAEAGENVARNKGFDDPVREAVGRWWDSDEHRVNILAKAATDTGIAAVEDRDGGYVYFTQIFVRRMPEDDMKTSYWRSRLPSMVR